MLGQNWKTNLASILTGLLTTVMGVPTLIAAIAAWSNHQPVDWRAVLTTTVMAIVTAGLAAAKDATTHSTQAQTAAASAVAKAETPIEAVKAESKVAAADVTAKGV